MKHFEASAAMKSFSEWACSQFSLWMSEEKLQSAKVFSPDRITVYSIRDSYTMLHLSFLGNTQILHDTAIFFRFKELAPVAIVVRG